MGCIKTGDCNHIIAVPQWKGHLDDVIAEEDLSNFDNLTTIDHPHFALILLKRLAKDLEKEKKVESVYDTEKVCAKTEAKQITKRRELDQRRHGSY
jgi:hypothetical protein